MNNNSAVYMLKNIFNIFSKVKIDKKLESIEPESEKTIWDWEDNSKVWVYQYSESDKKATIREGRVVRCNPNEGIVSVVFAGGWKTTYTDLRHYKFNTKAFFITSNSYVFITQDITILKGFLDEHLVIDLSSVKTRDEILNSEKYKLLKKMEERPVIQDFIRYYSLKEQEALKNDLQGPTAQDIDEYTAIKELLNNIEQDENRD